MFTPETMEPGKGYECTFTVKNIPLDEFGRPGGMLSLADIPVSYTHLTLPTSDLV